MAQPTDEKTLVEMLFRQDDTIISRLLDFYGYELTNVLTHRFGRDATFVQDVVTDALIQLWQNPHKYDPTKSSLKTFLARDVEGDLLNALAKKKGQKKSLILVELESNTRNIGTGEDLVQQVFTEEVTAEVRRFFASILPDESDQRLAWLIEIEQIRESAYFSEELGITHLSPQSQESEVKRAKDRIKAQLKRKGWAAFKEKLKQYV